MGAVSVHVASVPQGQGHRTVLAQVVADVFGLRPADIRVVTEMDTARDAWSIASGNYASRFAPAVAGVAHLAAVRLRDKLARIAAGVLNVPPARWCSRTAASALARNPDNALPFGRIAATSHWAPATLPADVDQAIRETVFWTPPELTAPTEADEVNSSLCHGFIFDFCAVEVDRATGELRFDRYVTMHDCGRILHPGMVAGQVTGGFAHALGAATLEEHAYAADGSFLAGTLADYLLPTAMEVPEPVDPAPRDAVALHPARRQRRRGGQLHVHAGLHRQRGGRRARPAPTSTLPLLPAHLASHPARRRARAPAPGRAARREAKAGRDARCAARARRGSTRPPSGSGRCCSTRDAARP